MLAGVDLIHMPDLLGQCQNIPLEIEWVAGINIKAPYLVQKTKTCSRACTKNPPLLIPVPCRQLRISWITFGPALTYTDALNT